MASLVALMLVMTMLSGVALGDDDLALACKDALVSLSPCLEFITGGSSTPTSSCCLQLHAIVESQPWCLCVGLKGNGAEIGVPINDTRAESLPRICRVKTQPVSECNKLPAGLNLSDLPSNASTPKGSVNPNNTTLPKLPTIPSAGTGPKSDSKNTSNGSMIEFPFHITLFLLFITSSVYANIAI
ncbi:non-specific lipid-transfer protein-like protein At2g13820 [Chenopodium quinoa]|uniref:non-specific lipid-transfer protein-like protein At2g13820 n=1 Tax=Chenopodium quinoa TaxID=63459 RepID=UPI000B7929D1|nr:non-specific lipid-transfer protein-like protein At2g13820 [Chenopodium quinoa]